MGLNVVINVGKKHLASFDPKLFEKSLRAELARDIDLHISMLEITFVDDPNSTVLVNNQFENEQAKTILEALNLTYFHLADEASSARTILRHPMPKEG